MKKKNKKCVIFIVQTKSWFEQEPEPALPNDDDEEYKELSKNNWIKFERSFTDYREDIFQDFLVIKIHF